MPVFKEYIAKGKISPVDMGFTAFETAARRQQSFTADQQSSIEKSSKSVSLAWDGALKFGLDEIEMAQHAGGGGVRVAGGGRVERTLTGTGTNPGITRNEVSRGTRDLASLARGLNNRISKPLTPGDGLTVDPDSGVTIAKGNQANQRIVQLQTNPQQIPLRPGDINLRRLTEYGVNPQKQITVEPLPSPSATPEGENDFKMGTVAGQATEQDIYPTDQPTPFPKSGAGVWGGIQKMLGQGTGGYPASTGDDLKRSGVDKEGVPFYGTVDNPFPKGLGD